MRIRTRYRVFRLVILVALLAFAFSLWDLLANDSGFFIPVMIAYAALFLLGLLLYLGHKPVLDDTVMAAEFIEATPEGKPAEPTPEPEEVIEVVELAKTRPHIASVNVSGPHHFKCPFCSHLFSMELTHLRGRKDFWMNCPYCANNIRIPRQPRLATGKLDAVSNAAPGEKALFTCTRCGEVLRFTAPGGRLDRFLHVQACPNCKHSPVVPAAG